MQPHSTQNPHQPSLSCGTKLYSGLKLQSPSLSADFYSTVNKSLQCRARNCKPTRSRIGMMPIGTPKVPYRVPGEGTWQWVDLWNALANDKLWMRYRGQVIFIGQHINEEFSNQILATMLYLDIIDDNKRLYLYINGPGGDLTPSLAISDTMQSLKSPVGTHCVGYACSLAGFLLATGEKSAAGAACGQADDILNEANKLLRIRDYLFSEVAKNAGLSIEKINKDLSRIKRLNGQEALEYGLIDRIVRPPRNKADAFHEDAVTGLG